MKRYSIVVIFLLSFNALFTMSFVNSQTEPPTSGDWIISDTTVMNDCGIVLYDDLTIQNGGSLTFNNVTLKLYATSVITVEPGGAFYIYESIIDGISSSYYYKFIVNGKMRIFDSSINNTWGPQYGDVGTSGIQIYSDDVIIYNSTICHGKQFGIGINGASPQIINCNISNNNRGLIARGSSSVKIEGCMFDNPYDDIVFSQGCRGNLSNSTVNGQIDFYDSSLIQINNISVEDITVRDGSSVTFYNSSISDMLIFLYDSEIIFVNTTYDESRIWIFNDTCTLTIKWFLHVKVIDSTNNAVPLASVNVQDNNEGTFNSNYTTNSDGWARWIRCPEFFQKGDIKTNVNPIAIRAENGNEKGKTEININENLEMIIDLDIINYPPTQPTEILPIQTHSLTPTITWTEGTDQNQDMLIYHIDIWKNSSSSGEQICNDLTTIETHYQIINPLNYGTSYYVELYAEDIWGDKSQKAIHIFDVINNIPTMPGINITPSNPTTKDEIICRIDTISIDVDSDPTDSITYTFQWYKNGLLQNDFTKNDTVMLISFIPSNKTKRGDIWECLVTPFDTIEEGDVGEDEIIIKNSIPRVKEPIPPFNVEEDYSEPLTVNLFDVFTDDDDDELKFSIRTKNNNGLIINEQNETAVITLKPNWCGNEVITFIANDTSSEINHTVELIARPVNDPPVLNKIGTLMVNEGDWFNFTLSAYDVDGDNLSYGINVSLLNLLFDKSTGAISFLPNNNNVGTLYIEIGIDDNNGSKIYQEVIIIINNTNNPPEIPIINSPFNNSMFTIYDPIDFIGTCEDPDEKYGDILTYQWYSSIMNLLGNGSELKNITLEAGNHEISFSVRDAFGEKSQTMIILNISTEEDNGKINNNNDEDEFSGNNLLWISLLVIIVLIIIILVLFIRRGKESQNRKIHSSLDHPKQIQTTQTTPQHLSQQRWITPQSIQPQAPHIPQQQSYPPQFTPLSPQQNSTQQLFPPPPMQQQNQLNPQDEPLDDPPIYF